MRKVTLLTTVVLVAFSSVAMAQAVMVAPVPDGPTINGQPLVQAILSLIGDVGPYILAAVAAWIGKNVKNQYLKDALIAATKREANGVYESLVTAGQSVNNIPVKNAAIASAVNNMTLHYADTMNLFGVTPDTIHNMIRKEFGGILVNDPTVTVASDPVAMANVNPTTLSQYLGNVKTTGTVS